MKCLILNTPYIWRLFLLSKAKYIQTSDSISTQLRDIHSLYLRQRQCWQRIFSGIFVTLIMTYKVYTILSDLQRRERERDKKLQSTGTDALPLDDAYHCHKDRWILSN